ncbi:response regulator [Methylococcus geothermalis]|uniref:Response regulator n=1 Tax=Methylococcus geothermalis TaxID=2681310 RepID=A0A858Q5Z5_9GAMM|nr:response regulator [Methylococcus geothermalis]QJD29270.1 response regulator [Methylococcus geothermalis]
MQAPTTRILIVDDDVEIRNLLGGYLSRFGMEAVGAHDGAEMKKALAETSFDLVVLDLMLPGEDGLSLCRSLRTESDIPVIMLTARGDPMDRVVGLELGADDYVAKPFEPRELVARIQTILRRARHERETESPEASDIAVEFEGWRLHRVLRQLTSPDGMVVPLSNAEFRLLSVFIERPNRILTRDQLLDYARGRAMEVFDRSIDLLVSRLRQKLQDDPRNPKLIKTIRGEGYFFSAQVSKCGA